MCRRDRKGIANEQYHPSLVGMAILCRGRETIFFAAGLVSIRCLRASSKCRFGASVVPKIDGLGDNLGDGPSLVMAKRIIHSSERVYTGTNEKIYRHKVNERRRRTALMALVKKLYKKINVASDTPLEIALHIIINRLHAGQSR